MYPVIYSQHSEEKGWHDTMKVTLGEEAEAVEAIERFLSEEAHGRGWDGEQGYFWIRDKEGRQKRVRTAWGINAESQDVLIALAEKPIGPKP